MSSFKIYTTTPGGGVVTSVANATTAESLQSIPISSLNPTNGQILVYNASNGQWENQDSSSSVYSALNTEITASLNDPVNTVNSLNTYNLEPSNGTYLTTNVTDITLASDVNGSGVGGFSLNSPGVYRLTVSTLMRSQRDDNYGSFMLLINAYPIMTSVNSFADLNSKQQDVDMIANQNYSAIQRQWKFSRLITVTTAPAQVAIQTIFYPLAFPGSSIDLATFNSNFDFDSVSSNMVVERVA
jgi:hypothetical protein